VCVLSENIQVSTALRQSFSIADTEAARKPNIVIADLSDCLSDLAVAFECGLLRGLPRKLRLLRTEIGESRHATS